MTVSGGAGPNNSSETAGAPWVLDRDVALAKLREAQDQYEVRQEIWQELDRLADDASDRMWDAERRIKDLRDAANKKLAEQGDELLPEGLTR